MVAVIRDNQDPRQAEEFLDELEFLAETADIVSVKRFTQRLPQPSARIYVGPGKLEEIAGYCRISKLKEDLQKIDRQMAVQRSNRGSMVRVALVGYTNVGKSTLMNLISKSEVFAENKLFATLDTTVRKVVFDNLPFLLSDTVGFIRKLPTELIESFKSTLDEVREADLLVPVVDISHPQFEEQIDVVKQTLQEIGAGDKPVYLVFNKVDAYTYVRKDDDDLTPATRENLSLDDLKKSWIARANTPCIFLSALAKTNLEKFRSDLYGMVREIHAGRYPFNNFLY